MKNLLIAQNRLAIALFFSKTPQNFQGFSLDVLFETGSSNNLENSPKP